MNALQYLFWYFNTIRLPDVVFTLLRTFVVCVIYYQIDYAFLFVRYFWRKLLGAPDFRPLGPTERHDAVLVIPTLLRNREELETIQRAVTSVSQNGYPGLLYVVCSIDGRHSAPALYAELEGWLEALPKGPQVLTALTGTEGREGKAMAIDHAIVFVEQLSARMGRSYPTIFFNMDADGDLADHTLERMVSKLAEPSRFGGTPGMMVAPNVKVRKDHYWQGVRSLFTVNGFLRLAIATEYMTAISAAKHNSKILPTIVASGALYCTWSEIPRLSARYARFIQSLRYRDILRWWLGLGAPHFDPRAVEPLPEALTGEGDDAWMTWLATCAEWRDGRISIQFPRTPWHALGRLIKRYFVRVLRYDAEAKVYTRSPDKVRALFKQRLRWNGSRIWGIQRWHKAFAYHWTIAFPVLLNTAFVLLTVIMIGYFVAHTVAAGSLKDLLPALVLVHGGYVGIRLFSLAVAFLYEANSRDQWHKVLCVPLMPFYQLVFNVSTTLIALFQDVLLFGLKTGFAPEWVLARGQTSRIALAYRLRRFLRLCWRSAAGERIPFGAFWFGWQETPWTTNGYTGWDGVKSAHAAPVAASRAVAAARPVPQQRGPGDA